MTSLTVNSVSDNPNSLLVEWVPPTTPCLPDNYTVEYQITNKDQCDDTIGDKTMFRVLPSTTITITGLHAYSTYTVFVSSNNHVGSNEDRETAMTAMTGKHRKTKLLIRVILLAIMATSIW